MLFDLLFLLPLFLIGAVASYTDIKYSKIKNSWLLVGFGWGAMLYIGSALYSIFYLKQPQNLHYLLEIIINTLIAFLVGYLLWYFDFWAPGDAKLFTLYAFLIPLSFYSKSYFPYFPSLGLLINLFIPLFFFFAIKGVIFSSKTFFAKIGFLLKQKGNQKSLKERLSVKKIESGLFNFIQLVFLIILLQILMREIQFPFEKLPQLKLIYFVIFLALMFLFRPLMKKKLLPFLNALLGVGTIFYLIFSDKINFRLTILKTSLIFLALFFILRSLLNFYIENKEIRKIKIKELKEGAILSEEDIKEINKKLKDKKMSISKGILKKEETDLIKKLFEKEPEKEIKIYQTFPFAPFLLLSALITILTENSLSAFILKILENIVKF